MYFSVDEFATTSEVVSANNPPSQEESQNNPGLLITLYLTILKSLQTNYVISYR